MMKLVISLAIGLHVAFGVIAQTPLAGTPPPSPPPTSTTPPPTTVNAQPARSRPVDIRRFQNFPLNPVSQSDRLAARVVRLHGIIGPVYRKPGTKETASLAPEASFLQRYDSLLRTEGTGIIRLAPDRGCVYSERVVSAAEDCLKYSFPGAGNSFSFRTEGYRLRHLADITYVDDKLRITGIFMHGFAVDLGDVPIESASLDTQGMAYLRGFEPSVTADDVASVDNKFIEGVKADDFVYTKELSPSVNRTYGIRAVAYRGKVARSAAGIRYNELDYDKRRDVIAVFRVLNIDDDGITLIWRKLADTEPPRIRMPKAQEKETDGNEAN